MTQKLESRAADEVSDGRFDKIAQRLLKEDKRLLAELAKV